MKKLLSMVLTAVGLLAAGAATTGCLLMIFDEPEMPKAMLEK